MQIILTVIAGPHEGLEFTFDRHDTFLVGRSQHAHFQLPAKDKYFSRIHFMIEVNPPSCRLIDMGSHNGTWVNGVQVLTADLSDGDQIRAGHNILRLQVKTGGTASVCFEQPANPDRAFPSVPGYKLERELGTGAMGATYLGQRGSTPTMYAIKVVQPAFQGSPEQIDDFLRQARCLTDLDHPNIARLREVGVCPSGFFFVSDFVPGLNAAQIIERDGPLAINRAVRWGSQIMKALRHAHEHHVIHRNIKPTNIVVAEIDGKEYAKLTDVSIARVFHAAPFSGLSLTTAMINFASFIPPEVLFNFQEINPLADQYSLAAVLYYLLTGANVVDIPKDERKRFSTLLRNQFVPIRERRAEVPLGLADVVHKALSRTPTLRYTDMTEFRHAMIHAVEEE